MAWGLVSFRMTKDSSQIVHIRPLGTDDFELFWPVRLLALRESPQAFGSSYEESKKMPPKEAMRRLKPKNDGFVLGAFVSAAAADLATVPELVGLAGFVRHDFLKGRHKGTIWGVYVVPDYRGRGISRAVMEKVIERCQGIDGLEEVNLAVASSNEPARALYQSLGFETYGVEPRALKVDGKYFDEELMVLRFHGRRG
jgi:ribosomal protein S18 acetylase RimI-like enzyme